MTLNSAHALLRRYVHGPGVDEPLVWYEGTGTSDRRWLHADERGSIVAISNASGAVTNVNAYDEYGIPRPTNVGRFQYTGQQWIAELGLYHYRARIYSPTLGRFLQTDPIGYGGGMNLYAYVGNDPVNFTDPSGLGKDQGDTPPPKCVGDYCGNTGGTIVVTGPSIPEPKAPEPPLPGVSLVVVSTGVPSNEQGVSQAAEETTKECPLAQPDGDFTKEPQADPRFNPSFAAILGRAFAELNARGIRPHIVSAFRTSADQARMRGGASGSNPAAEVSLHQVGMAIDLNTRTPDFRAIRDTMVRQGLTWGGNFRRVDRPHFQLPPPGTRPNREEAATCEREN